MYHVSSLHSKTCSSPYVVRKCISHLQVENSYKTVWIVTQHPVSLFQDQYQTLFRSRAVKHQLLSKLPIAQLPWTIGWCNLSNKTNLHSTHLTVCYFSPGDMGTIDIIILIQLFEQQCLSEQQFKTLLALLRV